jgi:hypothetical protein
MITDMKRTIFHQSDGDLLRKCRQIMSAHKIWYEGGSHIVEEDVTDYARIKLPGNEHHAC